MLQFVNSGAEKGVKVRFIALIPCNGSTTNFSATQVCRAYTMGGQTTELGGIGEHCLEIVRRGKRKPRGNYQHEKRGALIAG